MIKSNLEVLLTDVVRSKWGDKGIEYLVGAISSVTTSDQLTALINANLDSRVVRTAPDGSLFLGDN
jgi:hypothetical protein